ncbi:MAG: LuxR family transcriptional regulator [Burkholderiaceae bacterium]|nr:LuxR family transcriptional regulator [Burkholderiaceae bacterium]
MLHIDDLVELLSCNDPDDWSTKLIEIAKNFGFEQVLFGMVPHKTVPLETAFLRSNYAASWRQTYDEQKMHYVDPTVAHCLNSSLPIVWQPSIFKSQQENEFYEQARSYWLRSGICIPIHGATGEFGVMSFVSSEADHLAIAGDAQSLGKLTLMRDYAQESAIQFLAKADVGLDDVHLTKREYELLKWLALGKTAWEISKILICSESNVNFHVKNIKRKLRVGSRQQAVVKAIKQGLIYPA